MEDSTQPEPREQARIVRDIVKRQSGLREGDRWNLLSMRWWDVWKDYTRYSDEEAKEAAEALEAGGAENPPQRRQLPGATQGSRPPCIDNSHLMAEPGSERLRMGLEEYSDYVLVPEQAWVSLERWYKGGPPISRSVVSVGSGSSAELRIDFYPLRLTVVRADQDGVLTPEKKAEVCALRSGSVEALVQQACDAFGIDTLQRTDEYVRLWRSAPSQASGSEIPSLGGYVQLLATETRSLEDLGVQDGAELVFEQSYLVKKDKYAYSATMTRWPFFRSLRLAYKRKVFKDPADPSVRLTVGDKIDAGVEGYSATSWYPASIVGEEEDRVLVEFSGRERPKMKLPALVTEAGWLGGERQLTPEAKTAFETVFKRYATDGKIDKGGVRGMLSCATNRLIQDDSYLISDLLTKYGNGAVVDLEGFLKYWRTRAAGTSYLVEDEVGRLFERVGATFGAQTEADKLLMQGQEWIPRNSTRLAMFRSKEYGYNVKPKVGKDFKRYDKLDVNVGGTWKKAEVVDVNWEEMTVQVQASESSESSYSYNSSYNYNKNPKEWIPMESDRLAEFETKSLEAVEEDTGPLLARTTSKGGACSRPGACGLQNLGNTCFMNATLQCLSNCSALRTYFAGSPEQAPAFQAHISSSPLSHKGRLAREFSRLLCQMWSNTVESTAPAELKALVGQKRPEFLGYQQQDAQELLIFLLDGLHEDVNLAEYPRPIVPEVESDGRPDAEVARQSWEGHLKRNNSRIVELFQFQIRSEVECPVCSNVSVTFDPIMYLSIPVPKPPHTVTVTVLSADYPTPPPQKVEVEIEKTASFEELDRRLWRRLGRSPTSPPTSTFVFADVWGDRVYKLFPPAGKITDIQHGDALYALETPLPPGSPDPAEVIYLPVLIRREKESTYAYSSTTHTYDRIAPPCLLAVTKQTTNRWVRAQLDQIGKRLLSATEQESPFDIVSHIDTYAGTRGSDVPDDDTPFAQPATQHLGVNYKVNDAAVALQQALPKTTTKVDSGAASSATTLHSCLQKNAEREQLSEDDSVYCRKCKEHQRCWKKIDIWSLPSQLIVHLKRFGRDRIDGPLTKITSAVDFPLELDLSGYLARKPETGGAMYDLAGVVNHHGGMSGGHYTAHALVTSVSDDGTKRSEGEWFNFNDSSAKRDSDLDKQAGYILFYRRREQEQPR